MFNAKEQTEKIISFIREYFEKENIKGVVIGLSGGKDSAVVAGLFTKAIGKENVLGLTLPCQSKVEDMEDAKVVANYFGFELINIDLTSTYDTFKKEISNIEKDESKLINSDINIKPRLRMSTLYYMAAYYSALKNSTYIVAGTGNKSEGYVGYFTKGGDSISDIKVLSDLTVGEVIQVGEVLNVPKKVLYKTPSDGISGKSDEEKLGITYKEIDAYISNEPLKDEVSKKIEKLHQKSQHKFIIPEYKK